ncbi:MAG: glycosyltransferase family 2 protein, partial [Acidobacteria bacterium]|nr:glycosyltransferase family 2 protein [Acidobacteriota bacterium]
MRLDVIIPTYNRHEMLARTLRSLLVAEVPRGLEARVTVVDNNSKDRTRGVVEEWAAKFGGRLGYVFETKQGRSPAINAGVRATDGDLVGFIDDDEEVDSRWFVCAFEAFRGGGVDFIGGPCV